MNSSFDGRPVRIDLKSHRLLIIDPLALDGLRDQLAAIGAAEAHEHVALVKALAGLRVGLHEVEHFQPGTYELDLDSFEQADLGDATPEVFEVDSGAVVIIDLTILEAVARAFTWERYDALLQSPPGDDSAVDALIHEVGSGGFAIVSADAAKHFSGDGAFRLKHDHPVRVA